MTSRSAARSLRGAISTRVYLNKGVSIAGKRYVHDITEFRDPRSPSLQTEKVFLPMAGLVVIWLGTKRWPEFPSSARIMQTLKARTLPPYPIRTQPSEQPKYPPHFPSILGMGLATKSPMQGDMIPNPTRILNRKRLT